MSIMQEYEQVKQLMGKTKYKSLMSYLKQNRGLLLSDVLYSEQNYKKFEQWHNARTRRTTLRV